MGGFYLRKNTLVEKPKTVWKTHFVDTNARMIILIFLTRCDVPISRQVPKMQSPNAERRKMRQFRFQVDELAERLDAEVHNDASLVPLPHGVAVRWHRGNKNSGSDDRHNHWQHRQPEADRPGDGPELVVPGIEPVLVVILQILLDSLRSGLALSVRSSQQFCSGRFVFSSVGENGVCVRVDGRSVGVGRHGAVSASGTGHAHTGVGRFISLLKIKIVENKSHKNASYTQIAFWILQRRPFIVIQWVPVNAIKLNQIYQSQITLK